MCVHQVTSEESAAFALKYYAVGAHVDLWCRS